MLQYGGEQDGRDVQQYRVLCAARAGWRDVYLSGWSEGEERCVESACMSGP